MAVSTQVAFREHGGWMAGRLSGPVWSASIENTSPITLEGRCKLFGNLIMRFVCILDVFDTCTQDFDIDHGQVSEFHRVTQVTDLFQFESHDLESDHIRRVSVVSRDNHV